jgi:hypothetical protein
MAREVGATGVAEPGSQGVDALGMRRSLLLTTAVLALAAPHVADAAGTASTSKTATKTTSPCAQFDLKTRTDPVLGAGLSLTTPFPANLVPAGQPPRVDLTVGPAAAATAPAVTAAATAAKSTLTYTVTRRSAVLLTTSVPLPSETTALQLPASAGAPGAYQVEARLTVAGQEVGGTCLRYGVAMPGAKLDTANLPAGRDWGGPGPEREAVLQDALGGSITRRQISYANALANPAQYDFTAAAKKAAAHDVYLDVQVGQGGAAERAAINDGTWEAGVKKIVERHKGVVPYWEAWNEPNFDYFFAGTATDYVNKVLKPFYRAVKAADPAAKVVGGSTYGVDLDWWNAFAKAGGFDYVDVVAFHGYQWDSGWEGTGMVSWIIQLKQLKAKHGAAAKPLWDTESGYRSVSEAGGPWLQADWATRKLLWEKSLGIPSQSFLIEGGWEDWCVIDQYRGVKPAAMALSTMTTLLDGRAYVGQVKVKKSWVYAMRFGAQTKGGAGLVAIWTDGRTVTLPLQSAHTGWDATGAPISVKKTMKVGGSVQYLTFKPGQPLL